LESSQRIALTSTNTVIPAKQKRVTKTKPVPPKSAKETPVVRSKWGSVPTTPDPKPVAKAPPKKQAAVATLPKKNPDPVVKKQVAEVSEEVTDSAVLKDSWKINLISSPEKAKVVSFSNRARSKGIRTEMEEASVKGTQYWRVQVTGFATHGEAKAYADTVIKEQLGIKDTWILKR
jgi:hypothetical protein